jgi:hypothetical protein
MATQTGVTADMGRIHQTLHSQRTGAVNFLTPALLQGQERWQRGRRCGGSQASWPYFTGVWSSVPGDVHDVCRHLLPLQVEEWHRHGAGRGRQCHKTSCSSPMSEVLSGESLVLWVEVAVAR